jgi:5-methyltetrahydropteroyltriglutamate--homocysteine methyltransferase
MSARPRFRADHVGSLLRPSRLKAAFRDLAGERIDQSEFDGILDDCIRDAISRQEAIGLGAVTDGEFRRGSWFFGFVQAVDGMTTRPAQFSFEDDDGGHAEWETAYAEAHLARRRGITTPEFEFIRAASTATPKVTMPAPSLAHFFRANDAYDKAVYSDEGQFWADLVAVYRGEIDALAEIGCDYVQFDEVPCAMMGDPQVRARVAAAGLDVDQLLERYIGAANAILDAAPAGMTTAMHLCRGNYRGRWMASGGYDYVAARLFAEVAVDTFFLEYDSERAGDFAPLAEIPEGCSAVLGLVSSKSPELEPADQLKRRLDEAANVLPMERLGISPQCGFASSVAGNPLSEDDQWRKLERVVEVANSVWGEA